MLSDAILGTDLLSKSGFKIEFSNNKINIINLNNDIIMKDNDDNFDEILCIDLVKTKTIVIIVC